MYTADMRFSLENVLVTCDDVCVASDFMDGEKKI